LTRADPVTTLASMARPAPSEPDEETIPVPRSVRFPVELAPPAGFDPADLATWPRVEGRLEWVEGRLLYMPPCGDGQQDTVADLVAALVGWVRGRPGFVVGTNEAGLRLGDDSRGADAAVWRRGDLAAYTGGFRRVPPVLAAEVGGRDEGEAQLREKARWYLDAGVEVVWLLLPESREIVVLTGAHERRHRTGEVLPSHASLPGLAPAVDELFRQVSTSG
jgi:Uma2 family endonuclease